MTCRDSKQTELIRGLDNIDLYSLRSLIAREGYLQGKVDICGKGWPKEINIVEESRDGFWHQRKMEILKNYHFNLCFENTNIPYYCTEKIWQSIAGGNLPIYYGKGNRIYDDFPRNSFIDYSEFATPNELFSYVDLITLDEFRTRMMRASRCLIL